MKAIYKKENNKIIIEIPFFSSRQNPWTTNKIIKEYRTLTGLIIRHKKDGNDWEEMGFAYTIDMDYKDKDDQYTGIEFSYYGEEKDFEKLCVDFNIKLIILEE